jgi:uncharacterized protein (DUF1015 family)
MPDLRPFRALTFDPARIGGDLSLAVAEPYDKVTDTMRAQYLKACPYNVTRVDLPREEVDGKDRYATAAQVFRGWVEKGVVRRAERPAIYLYEQSFSLPDVEERFTRRAIIGLVEAKEHGKGDVLPHERTFREPKADRMALLEAVRAHFGMVFLLYRDQGRGLMRRVAQFAAGRKPLFEFSLPDKTSHKLFAIEDATLIAAAREALSGNTCVIADGHHRYETAIAFRREHEKKGDVKPGHAYRTAAFVDADDPGLTILPTHRLLPKNVSAQQFVDANQRFLRFAKMDEPARFSVFRFESPKEPELALGIPYALREEVDLAKELPDLAEPVRKLDVTILHKLLLEKGLGIDSSAKEHTLGYVRWPDEGLAKLEAGAFGSMVVLRGTTPHDVFAVAESGAVMPQKSTDFYPKLQSGLVMNDIEDNLYG